MHLTQQALFFSIKKAFTPFAVLYMLKQMQIADEKQTQVCLIEKKPFVLYKIKYPVTLNDTTIVQKFTLTGSSSAESGCLRRLSCSCSFYHNYQMICWHMLLLLTKLQLKHIGCFEHLKFWREIVGTKNKERQQDRAGSTQNAYKVKKEKRLRSFIETISNKVKQRVNKLAKEKGIKLQQRHAGGAQSQGDEEEYAQLCEEARKKDVKQRNIDKKREQKKERKKQLKNKKNKK